MSYRLRGMGALSCPQGQVASPINSSLPETSSDPKAILGSDPSNWHCVQDASAPLTFAAGIAFWGNPATALSTALSSVQYLSTQTAYVIGLWTPILLAGGLAWKSFGGGRSPRRYGR